MRLSEQLLASTLLTGCVFAHLELGQTLGVKDTQNYPYDCSGKELSQGFQAKFYSYPYLGVEGELDDFFLTQYETVGEYLGSVKDITDINFESWGSLQELYGFPLGFRAFTFELTGFFKAPQTGIYTINFGHISSGASLQIGRRRDVDCSIQDFNDLLRQELDLKRQWWYVISQHVAVSLEEGKFYPIRIVFFNRQGIFSKFHIKMLYPDGSEHENPFSDIYQIERQNQRSHTTVQPMIPKITSAKSPTKVSEGDFGGTSGLGEYKSSHSTYSEKKSFLFKPSHTSFDRSKGTQLAHHSITQMKHTIMNSAMKSLRTRAPFDLAFNPADDVSSSQFTTFAGNLSRVLPQKGNQMKASLPSCKKMSSMLRAAISEDHCPSATSILPSSPLLKASTLAKMASHPLTTNGDSSILSLSASNESKVGHSSVKGWFLSFASFDHFRNFEKSPSETSPKSQHRASQHIHSEAMRRNVLSSSIAPHPFSFSKPHLTISLSKSSYSTPTSILRKRESSSSPFPTSKAVPTATSTLNNLGAQSSATIELRSKLSYNIVTQKPVKDVSTSVTLPVSRINLDPTIASSLNYVAPLATATSSAVSSSHASPDNSENSINAMMNTRVNDNQLTPSKSLSGNLKSANRSQNADLADISRGVGSTYSQELHPVYHSASSKIHTTEIEGSRSFKSTPFCSRSPQDISECPIQSQFTASATSEFQSHHPLVAFSNSKGASSAYTTTPIPENTVITLESRPSLVGKIMFESSKKEEYLFTKKIYSPVYYKSSSVPIAESVQNSELRSVLSSSQSLTKIGLTATYHNELHSDSKATMPAFGSGAKSFIPSSGSNSKRDFIRASDQHATSIAASGRISSNNSDTTSFDRTGVAYYDSADTSTVRNSFNTSSRVLNTPDRTSTAQRTTRGSSVGFIAEIQDTRMLAATLSAEKPCAECSFKRSYSFPTTILLTDTLPKTAPGPSFLSVSAGPFMTSSSAEKRTNSNKEGILDTHHSAGGFLPSKTLSNRGDFAAAAMNSLKGADSRDYYGQQSFTTASVSKTTLRKSKLRTKVSVMPLPLSSASSNNSIQVSEPALEPKRLSRLLTGVEHTIAPKTSRDSSVKETERAIPSDNKLARILSRSLDSSASVDSEASKLPPYVGNHTSVTAILAVTAPNSHWSAPYSNYIRASESYAYTKAATPSRVLSSIREEEAYFIANKSLLASTAANRLGDFPTSVSDLVTTSNPTMLGSCAENADSCKAFRSQETLSLTGSRNEKLGDEALNDETLKNEAPNDETLSYNTGSSHSTPKSVLIRTATTCSPARYGSSTTLSADHNERFTSTAEGDSTHTGFTFATSKTPVGFVLATNDGGSSHSSGSHSSGSHSSGSPNSSGRGFSSGDWQRNVSNEDTLQQGSRTGKGTKTHIESWPLLTTSPGAVLFNDKFSNKGSETTATGSAATSDIAGSATSQPNYGPRKGKSSVSGQVVTSAEVTTSSSFPGLSNYSPEFDAARSDSDANSGSDADTEFGDPRNDLDSFERGSPTTGSTMSTVFGITRAQTASDKPDNEGATGSNHATAHNTPVTSPNGFRPASTWLSISAKASAHTRSLVIENSALPSPGVGAAAFAALLYLI